jgi:hypothetical protein
VVELKRDPHAPFESVQQVLIIQVNSETRHWYSSFYIIFKGLSK